jgi:hypothetical protein
VVEVVVEKMEQVILLMLEVAVVLVVSTTDHLQFHLDLQFQ